MARWIAISFMGLLACATSAEVSKVDKEIRLIVRGDDMGSCHAANEACIQCFRKGIVQSVEVMVRIIENLTPGTWLFVDHPGLDTPEMQGICHLGYENVAADRARVTRAFTSDKAREAVHRRKIRLISYAEYYGKASAISSR